MVNDHANRLDARAHLARAWRAVRGSKYLLALGVVVAAAGLGLDGGLSGLVWLLIRRGMQADGAAAPLAEAVGASLGAAAAELPASGGVSPGELLALIAGVFGVLLLAGSLSVIGVGVIARAAAGSLIAGVGADGGPGALPLREALRTGWQRAWRLIIILSIPPIPATVGAILSVAGVGILLYAAGLSGDPAGALALLRESRGLHVALAALNAPLVVVSLALAWVQIMADRACVLEDRRALDSFRRGWQVMRPHLASAAGLLLLQLGVGVAVGVLLRLPGMAVPAGALAPLACLLRPLAWLVTGGLVALFSALWTLAWRGWAGRAGDGAQIPQP